MKRVPSCTASAPSASIAAMPAPSAIPPLAMTGSFVTCSTRRTSPSVPTSEGGGCPPASAPSTTSASTPAASALRACSTEATTWNHFVPTARKRAKCSRGPPCDATITGMRASNAMSSISRAFGLLSGMFTPYGFIVPALISPRMRRKSSMRSGPAASTPMPPAFDTAMTSAELDEAQLIAAWKIGYSMPSRSVMRVFTWPPSFHQFFSLDELARLAGELGERPIEHLVLGLRQAAAERGVAFRRRAYQALVDALAELAQREPHAPPVARMRSAQHDAALRQARHHPAHLALVDAGRCCELHERHRLVRRAEQRAGAPFPQAHAELAPVAQLRAAREQIRHAVQLVREQVLDLSHRRTASRCRRAAACRIDSPRRPGERPGASAAAPGRRRARGRRQARRTSPSAAGA